MGGRGENSNFPPETHQNWPKTLEKFDEKKFYPKSCSGRQKNGLQRFNGG